MLWRQRFLWIQYLLLLLFGASTCKCKVLPGNFPSSASDFVTTVSLVMFFFYFCMLDKLVCRLTDQCDTLFWKLEPLIRYNRLSFYLQIRTKTLHWMYATSGRVIEMVYGHFGPKTLRTQDISAPCVWCRNVSHFCTGAEMSNGHFGTKVHETLRTQK